MLKNKRMFANQIILRMDRTHNLCCQNERKTYSHILLPYSHFRLPDLLRAHTQTRIMTWNVVHSTMWSIRLSTQMRIWLICLLRYSLREPADFIVQAYVACAISVLNRNPLVLSSILEMMIFFLFKLNKMLYSKENMKFRRREWCEAHICKQNKIALASLSQIACSSFYSKSIWNTEMRRIFPNVVCCCAVSVVLMQMSDNIIAVHSFRLNLSMHVDTMHCTLFISTLYTSVKCMVANDCQCV